MKMTIKKILKPSFWKVVSVIIVTMGLVSTYLRFTKGLGATTNLQDSVPWGLWIGFDFIGVGLAAAGFTIAATVHIFNIHKYESLVRPAILTAFLGYMVVVCLLLVDLGRPENFWHPLVMWNIHSVMFEITWCIICYSTVLLLEFAPVILEKFKLKGPIKILKIISIPVVIAGVLFSTLHQSSFGSLYLIVPGKLHPLWYSSLLPVHFFISCVAAGLSMIIFESYLIARSCTKEQGFTNTGLKINILSGAAFVVWIALIAGLLLKLYDFISNGKLHYLTVPSLETNLFYLEIILGTIFPIILLSNKKIRQDKKWLYIISICVISGLILNRINVAITGLAATSGVNYFPSFDEISITMMLVVMAIFAFKLIAKNFSLFADEDSEHTSNVIASNKPKPIILSEQYE
ncbi:MAG: Ni/Fe-hydrogenase cytochrome b subunit [Ignavibacteriota bacterium]|nr:MAG: Ni/Fe-hydrogenase cytochrome b subunit [Chlorobiota bacterium]MBE7476713.1 Ni/Fe-hydrogenase cytochrome b subunit [Ignavibacteriales bacterium]MBL1122035.1 Ni/Fe-hydrogenase cytochrome b subunit [Ignavibacteriota bacterium]MCC7093594.1 Ni/Fe-hydrogenase cytochrome b subunit [Ignavibacteriaceae bacterium]MCE7856111.1 Ni/Fe-hydrogenase cytochrome b subunit [Ignavibacteria bacterium CHB3]